uniref:Uncharacterized protein n=1 Tax=Bicosoecida sp. CB-2014 TaxID=1486930 RepID=A0A7S1GE91_9STRA
MAAARVLVSATRMCVPRGRTVAACSSVRTMSSASSDLEAFKTAWKEETKAYEVVTPKFEWTLEWALPTPVPLHQFAESPVVVEVINRNPDNQHH